MTAPRPFYLHLIQRYYPFRGGSERYFQGLSERFVSVGARVQVVTSDAWDLEYFWDPRRKRVPETVDRHNGVDIRRVPVHHLPISSITHRAIRRLMAESCRAPFPGQMELLRQGSRFGPWLPDLEATLRDIEAPDLINSANVAFESMIATAHRLSRCWEIPHVVTPFLHLGEGASSRVRRYYTMPHQLELLRRADRLLVLTDFEGQFLAKIGIDEARIRVVGAGIDVDGVTRGDGGRIRERLRIDGVIVVSLGAAAFDKGTVHLIDAVNLLRQRGLDVHLVLAGPMMTEVERYLRAQSDRARIGIHALGFVSDEERRDLLAAATVLALPSRTESFGLVFMEAWANGLAVVGAKAGAIPSVVSDGIDGLLVHFGDVPALADSIETIITRPDLAAQLGANGRSKVVSEEQWFERVRAVYEELLGSPSAVSRMER
jgi:glycogen(starch) synthase